MKCHGNKKISLVNARTIIQPSLHTCGLTDFVIAFDFDLTFMHHLTLFDISVVPYTSISNSLLYRFPFEDGVIWLQTSVIQTTSLELLQYTRLFGWDPEPWVRSSMIR